MTRWLGWMVTFAMLAASTATAADSPAAARKVSLASPGLNVVRLEPKVGAFYSDHFAQQLALQGLTVITAGEVQALLGFERQKALLGCAEESSSCLAELAGALGVDGLVTGSLGRAGRRLIVNIKIVSARDGRALSVQSGNVSDEDALVEWLDQAAAAAAAEVKRAVLPPVVENPPGPRLGAEGLPPESAPPAVSMEVRRGSLAPTLVAGSLGGILLATSAVTYLMARSSYDRLTQWEGPLGKVPEEVRRGESLQTASALSAGVATAALIGAGWLYFNRGESAAPMAGLSVSAHSVAFTAGGVFP